VACVSSLDAQQHDQLRRARNALEEAISEPGFTYSPVGARFVASLFAPEWMVDLPDGVDGDVRATVDSSDFAKILGDRLIVPPPDLGDDGRRFVELRRDLDETTACVVGEPA
jgi:hypothetical protein